MEQSNQTEILSKKSIQESENEQLREFREKHNKMLVSQAKEIEVLKGTIKKLNSERANYFETEFFPFEESNRILRDAVYTAINDLKNSNIKRFKAAKDISESLLRTYLETHSFMEEMNREKFDTIRIIKDSKNDCCTVSKNFMIIAENKLAIEIDKRNERIKKAVKESESKTKRYQNKLSEIGRIIRLHKKDKDLYKLIRQVLTSNHSHI